MNLFQKVLRYGADVALPVERVDETTKAVRYAVCKACDRYDPESDKCRECGCFMAVKTGTKTHRNPANGMRVEITHCPLGKWDDKAVADYYSQENRKYHVSQTIEP